jgi:hypothetical protein
MIRRDVKPAMIYQLNRMLGEACRFAVTNRWITSNPTEGTTRPKYVQTRSTTEKIQKPAQACAIKLPREVLTIRADEDLHQYLRRVATCATTAATTACGSMKLAYKRLGCGDFTENIAESPVRCEPTTTHQLSFLSVAHSGCQAC